MMGYIDWLKNGKSIYYTYALIFLLAIVPVVEMINIQFGKIVTFSLIDNLLFLSLSIFLFLVRKKINDFSLENKYALGMGTIFVVYQFILIGRAFPLEANENLKYFITIPHVLWPHIIPLALFYEKSIESIIHLIRAVFFMALAFTAISFIDYPILLERLTGETVITTLTLPIGLLSMNAYYFSPKKRIIIFLALSLALIFSILLARRSCILTYSLFLFISVFLLMIKTKLSTYIKLSPYMAVLICIFIINGDLIFEKLTAKLKERINEDTRTEVFDNYFKSMEKDMNFGKGMTGEYYSPNDETITEDGVRFDEIVYRNLIENGYLQMILTGGIANIVGFALIAIPAIFLALFYSSSNFMRALGVFILLYMIDMFFYGLPRLNVHYLIIWISIGICYKKSLRDIGEDEWKLQFSKYSLL